MSVTIRGNALTTPMIAKGSGGKRNTDGTVTTDLTFAIDAASWTSYPRRGVTVHPYWSDFVCDDFSWSKPIGKYVLLKVTYIRLLPDMDMTGTSLPPDVEVECACIASEEPITSVPNFLKTVGASAGIAVPTDGAWPEVDGLPVTVDPTTGMFPVVSGTTRPLNISNGAVFDTFGQNKEPSNTTTFNPQVGRFLYFRPGSKFCGLESVLIPRGTYSYSYASETAPSLGKVGTTGLPKSAPALNPLFSYNWLLVSTSYRKTGVIYRVTESWRVSGPRGWMPELYPAG